MSRDWCAALIDQRRQVSSSRANAENWYRFFEEISLRAVYSEATGDPKQNQRDTYMQQVAPKSGEHYCVPTKGTAIPDTLSMIPTIQMLTTWLPKLPLNSWFLQFRFRLSEPYLSKDDVPFYVIDNPVRKEKVFKLPIIAATAWKGNLRAVLRYEQNIASVAKECDHALMIRLFGNVKGEEAPERFKAGRLRFFSTFFTKIGQEVINPHDREGGAGKQPIYFECVPKEAEGVFTLLYLPFDMVGKPDDWHDPVTGKTSIQIAASDMTMVIDATARLLTQYGFGAKTSSGFGKASVRFNKEIDPKTNKKRASGVLCFRTQDGIRSCRVDNFNELFVEGWKLRKNIAGGNDE